MAYHVTIELDMLVDHGVMCVYIYVYIKKSICVCVYIYIYIYIYKQICEHVCKLMLSMCCGWMCVHVDEYHSTHE